MKMGCKTFENSQRFLDFYLFFKFTRSVFYTFALKIYVLKNN